MNIGDELPLPFQPPPPLFQLIAPIPEWAVPGLKSHMQTNTDHRIIECSNAAKDDFWVTFTLLKRLPHSLTHSIVDSANYGIFSM